MKRQTVTGGEAETHVTKRKLKTPKPLAKPLPLKVKMWTLLSVAGPPRVGDPPYTIIRRTVPNVAP